LLLLSASRCWPTRPGGFASFIVLKFFLKAAKSRAEPYFSAACSTSTFSSSTKSITW
jgi:hypothetical protein